MKKLKKILLVDDDLVNNYLNETILRDLSIASQICTEINGENALAHLAEGCEQDSGICPELVIFDHPMPVMDGMEMMKALHQKGFMDGQPIIFILLGVHSSKEHIAEFEKLGVHEYTEKPLSQEVIMDAYHKYFATL